MERRVLIVAITVTAMTMVLAAQQYKQGDECGPHEDEVEDVKASLVARADVVGALPRYERPAASNCRDCHHHQHNRPDDVRFKFVMVTHQTAKAKEYSCQGGKDHRDRRDPYNPLHIIGAFHPRAVILVAIGGVVARG